MISQYSELGLRRQMKFFFSDFFFFNVDPLHILPAGVFCLFFAYVFLVGIYKVAPTKPDTRELKPRMNLKGGGGKFCFVCEVWVE